MFSFNKITSVVVAVCFVLTSIGGQAAASVAANMRATEQYKQIFSDFMLPYSYGKITDAHFASTDRVIINIQDLHCHPKVQKNISNIIDLFDKRYGVKTVYLEGAYGDVDTNWITGIVDSNYKSKLLDKMIETGRLTGAEYYSALSGKTNIIKGLEKKEPYLENLKRFGDILENKEKISVILESVEKSGNELRTKYYDRRQLKIEEISKQYELGKITAEKYYILLAKHIDRLGIDITGYENTLNYMTLMEMQKHLKYGEITNQLQTLVLTLKGILPAGAYKMLLDSTGNLSQIDKLYGCLIKITRQYNLDMSVNYPELNKYFAYIELSQKINPLGLLEENKKLTEEINSRFSNTKAQSEVVFLVNFERYLKDYLTSKITSADYEYYKNNIATYKKLWAKYVDNKVLSLLDVYISQADKFYAVNTDRNGYFTENIFNEVLVSTITSSVKSGDETAKVIENMSQAKRIDIIITGGFHTGTVSEILKNNNVSYIVITPNVTDGLKTAEETYYKIAKEQSKISFQTLANLIASLSPVEQKRVLIAADPSLESKLGFIPVTQESVLSQEQIKQLAEIVKMSEVLLSDDKGEIKQQIIQNIKDRLESSDPELVKETDEELIKYVDMDKLKTAFENTEELKNLIERAVKIKTAAKASVAGQSFAAMEDLAAKITLAIEMLQGINLLSKEFSKSKIPGNTTEVKRENIISVISKIFPEYQKFFTDGDIDYLITYSIDFFNGFPDEKVFEKNTEELILSILDPDSLAIAIRPFRPAYLSRINPPDASRKQWFKEIAEECAKYQKDYLNKMRPDIRNKFFAAKLLRGANLTNITQYLRGLKKSGLLSNVEKAFLDTISLDSDIGKQLVIEEVVDYSSSRIANEGNIVLRVTLKNLSGNTITFFMKGLDKDYKIPNRKNAKYHFYENTFYWVAGILGLHSIYIDFYSTPDDRYTQGYSIMQVIPGEDTSRLFDMQKNGSSHFKIKDKYKNQKDNLIASFAVFAALTDLLGRGDSKIIKTHHPMFSANYMFDVLENGKIKIYPIDATLLFNPDNSHVIKTMREFGDLELGIILAFYEDKNGLDEMLEIYRKEYLETWKKIKDNAKQMKEYILSVYGEDSWEYPIFLSAIDKDPELLFEQQKQALLEYISANAGQDLGSISEGKPNGEELKDSETAQTAKPALQEQSTGESSVFQPQHKKNSLMRNITKKILPFILAITILFTGFLNIGRYGRQPSATAETQTVAVSETVAPAVMDSQLYGNNRFLFNYLRNNQSLFAPSDIAFLNASVELSNGSEAKELVKQIYETLGIGAETGSVPEILFVSGSNAPLYSACACSDINVIIIPLGPDLKLPSAGEMAAKVAHENTHIKNHQKVLSGEMSQLEDETMATEAGVVADETYEKNLVIESMFNGTASVNNVTAMPLFGFYSILENQESVVKKFIEITGDKNITFNDIYYSGVFFGSQNKAELPAEVKLDSLGENEVAIRLYYGNTSIMYVVKVDGSSYSLSKIEVFSDNLYVQADKEQISEKISQYYSANSVFGAEDVINSFDIVSVSEALLKACKINLEKLQFISFYFPYEREDDGDSDIIRFIVRDENGIFYGIDVKKDVGIIKITNNGTGEEVWKAKEGLSKDIIAPETSQQSGQRTGTLGTSVTIESSRPEKSDYSKIYKLSVNKLKAFVQNENNGISERFLAFLILKNKGINIQIPEEMLAAGKQYIRDIESGKIAIITAEEIENNKYKTADDRLKSALAAVYYIMLNSYINDFNIEQTVLDKIWKDIYENAKVAFSNSGGADSSFSFQPDSLTPDIIAHELLHNITDVYLGAEKNLTSSAFAEFSSDIARIICCQEIGIDIPSDLKDRYKEYAAYIKAGAIPLEEHYLARGIIGLIMEVSADAGRNVNWNNMMSAVSQCLQNADFVNLINSNNFNKVFASVLEKYLEIETGRTVEGVEASSEQTSELYDNIVKLLTPQLTMTWLSKLLNFFKITDFAKRQKWINTIENPIIILGLFHPIIMRWFVKKHKGESEEAVKYWLSIMLKQAGLITVDFVPTMSLIKMLTKKIARRALSEAHTNWNLLQILDPVVDINNQKLVSFLTNAENKDAIFKIIAATKGLPDTVLKYVLEQVAEYENFQVDRFIQIVKKLNQYDSLSLGLTSYLMFETEKDDIIFDFFILSLESRLLIFKYISDKKNEHVKENNLRLAINILKRYERSEYNSEEINFLLDLIFSFSAQDIKGINLDKKPNKKILNMIMSSLADQSGHSLDLYKKGLILDLIFCDINNMSAYKIDRMNLLFKMLIDKKIKHLAIENDALAIKIFLNFSFKSALNDKGITDIVMQYKIAIKLSRSIYSNIGENAVNLSEYKLGKMIEAALESHYKIAEIANHTDVLNDETGIFCFYNNEEMENGQGRRFTPKGIEKITELLGINPQGQIYLEIKDGQDPKQKAKEFLSYIRDFKSIKKQYSLKRGLFVFDGHGLDEEFFYSKTDSISAKDIAKALIAAKRKGVNLEEITIDLSCCHSYYLANNIIKILKRKGIRKLPQILTDAGYETVYSYDKGYVDSNETKPVSNLFLSVIEYLQKKKEAGAPVKGHLSFRDIFETGIYLSDYTVFINNDDIKKENKKLRDKLQKILEEEDYPDIDVDEKELNKALANLISDTDLIKTIPNVYFDTLKEINFANVPEITIETDSLKALIEGLYVQESINIDFLDRAFKKKLKQNMLTNFIRLQISQLFNNIMILFGALKNINRVIDANIKYAVRLSKEISSVFLRLWGSVKIFFDNSLSRNKHGNNLSERSPILDSRMSELTMTWLSKLLDFLKITDFEKRQKWINIIENPIIIIGWFHPAVMRWFIKQHEGQSEETVQQGINEILKQAGLITADLIPTMGLIKMLTNKAARLALSKVHSNWNFPAEVLKKLEITSENNPELISFLTDEKNIYSIGKVLNETQGMPKEVLAFVLKNILKDKFFNSVRFIGLIKKLKLNQYDERLLGFIADIVLNVDSKNDNITVDFLMTETKSEDPGYKFFNYANIKQSKNNLQLLIDILNEYEDSKYTEDEIYMFFIIAVLSKAQDPQYEVMKYILNKLSGKNQSDADRYIELLKQIKKQLGYPYNFLTDIINNRNIIDDFSLLNQELKNIMLEYSNKSYEKNDRNFALYGSFWGKRLKLAVNVLTNYGKEYNKDEINSLMESFFSPLMQTDPLQQVFSPTMYLNEKPNKQVLNLIYIEGRKNIFLAKLWSNLIFCDILFSDNDIERINILFQKLAVNNISNLAVENHALAIKIFLNSNFIDSLNKKGITDVLMQYKIAIKISRIIYSNVGEKILNTSGYKLNKMIETALQKHYAIVDIASGIDVFNDEIGVVAFYNNETLQNGRRNFSSQGIKEILGLLGISPKYSQYLEVEKNDGRQKIEQFLSLIADFKSIKEKYKLQGGYFLFNGHGNNKNLEYDHYIHGDIGIKEIADALIKAHESSVDLEDLTIDLSSCYSYYFANDVIKVLKQRGIRKYPQILTAAGYETVFSRGGQYDKQMYGGNFQMAIIRHLKMNAGIKKHLSLGDIFRTEMFQSDFTVFVTNDEIEIKNNELREELQKILNKADEQAVKKSSEYALGTDDSSLIDVIPNVQTGEDTPGGELILTESEILQNAAVENQRGTRSFILDSRVSELTMTGLSKRLDRKGITGEKRAEIINRKENIWIVLGVIFPNTIGRMFAYLHLTKKEKSDKTAKETKINSVREAMNAVAYQVGLTVPAGNFIRKLIAGIIFYSSNKDILSAAHTDWNNGIAMSEFVPDSEKISILLEMNNFIIYIDVDKSGNSKIVYVDAEIEPDYRDDSKMHEELKIPFDIKINYDEKRHVWNCLAIKNQYYKNNIKVRFGYSNKTENLRQKGLIIGKSSIPSTLQNKQTVEKLNKIGNGKFIKWLYGNNINKTGENFRYTVLGVAIGVILETFSLWTPNFIKSHDNPTMGMKITVWVIRALSIGIGVAVALNPVSLPFIIPAVILAEWITHFAWNQIQISNKTPENMLQTEISAHDAHGLLIKILGGIFIFKNRLVDANIFEKNEIMKTAHFMFSNMYNDQWSLEVYRAVMNGFNGVFSKKDHEIIHRYIQGEPDQKTEEELKELRELKKERSKLSERINSLQNEKNEAKKRKEDKIAQEKTVADELRAQQNKVEDKKLITEQIKKIEDDIEFEYYVSATEFENEIGLLNAQKNQIEQKIDSKKDALDFLKEQAKREKIIKLFSILYAYQTFFEFKNNPENRKYIDKNGNIQINGLKLTLEQWVHICDGHSIFTNGNEISGLDRYPSSETALGNAITLDFLIRHIESILTNPDVFVRRNAKKSSILYIKREFDHTESGKVTEKVCVLVVTADHEITTFYTIDTDKYEANPVYNIFHEISTELVDKNNGKFNEERIYRDIINEDYEIEIWHNADFIRGSRSEYGSSYPYYKRHHEKHVYGRPRVEQNQHSYQRKSHWKLQKVFFLENGSLRYYDSPLIKRSGEGGAARREKENIYLEYHPEFDDVYNKTGGLKPITSTLQNKSTVDKLNKIGNGKFIKWLYGNKAEKTGDNFRYTVLGVAIGVILETFSFWSPNFIKSHDNPTMGMKITVWVIRALSIGIGVTVALSPVLPLLLAPAVLLAEWIIHFIWNETQVLKDNSKKKALVLTEDEKIIIKDKLKELGVEEEKIKTFIALLNGIDFNDLLIDMEQEVPYSDKIPEALKMILMSFFKDTLDKTVNKLDSKKDFEIIYSMLFDGEINDETISGIVDPNRTFIFARIYGMAKWNAIKYKKGKFILTKNNWFHICEGHAVGFNESEDKNGRKYLDEAKEKANEYAIRPDDVNSVIKNIDNPKIIIPLEERNSLGYMQYKAIYEIDGRIYACVYYKKGNKNIISSIYRLSSSFYHNPERGVDVSSRFIIKNNVLQEIERLVEFDFIIDDQDYYIYKQIKNKDGKKITLKIDKEGNVIIEKDTQEIKIRNRKDMETYLAGIYQDEEDFRYFVSEMDKIIGYLFNAEVSQYDSGGSKRQLAAIVGKIINNEGRFDKVLHEINIERNQKQKDPALKMSKGKVLKYAMNIPDNTFEIKGNSLYRGAVKVASRDNNGNWVKHNVANIEIIANILFFNNNVYYLLKNGHVCKDAYREAKDITTKSVVIENGLKRKYVFIDYCQIGKIVIRGSDLGNWRLFKDMFRKGFLNLLPFQQELAVNAITQDNFEVGLELPADYIDLPGFISLSDEKRKEYGVNKKTYQMLYEIFNYAEENKDIIKKCSFKKIDKNKIIICFKTADKEYLFLLNGKNIQLMKLDFEQFINAVDIFVLPDNAQYKNDYKSGIDIIVKIYKKIFSIHGQFGNVKSAKMKAIEFVPVFLMPLAVWVAVIAELKKILNMFNADKTSSTLQNKTTVEILNKIGNGEFIKRLYGNKTNKTGENFKYTALGVAIGVMLEIFSLWNPNFIKSHENPTMGMKITVWVIRALSIGIGIAVVLNPVPLPFIIPAVILTEWITHFAWNQIQIAIDNKEQILQKSTETEETEAEEMQLQETVPDSASPSRENYFSGDKNAPVMFIYYKDELGIERFCSLLIKDAENVYYIASNDANADKDKIDRYGAELLSRDTKCDLQKDFGLRLTIQSDEQTGKRSVIISNDPEYSGTSKIIDVRIAGKQTKNIINIPDIKESREIDEELTGEQKISSDSEKREIIERDLNSKEYEIFYLEDLVLDSEKERIYKTILEGKFFVIYPYGKEARPSTLESLFNVYRSIEFLNSLKAIFPESVYPYGGMVKYPYGNRFVFKYILKEVLKNSFVHGNKLDFTKPIYMKIDIGDDGVLSVKVLNRKSSEALNRRKLQLAVTAKLAGVGLGRKQAQRDAQYFERDNENGLREVLVRDVFGRRFADLEDFVSEISGRKAEKTEPLTDFDRDFIRICGLPSEEIKSKSDLERYVADNENIILERLVGKDKTDEGWFQTWKISLQSSGFTKVLQILILNAVSDDSSLLYDKEILNSVVRNMSVSSLDKFLSRFNEKYKKEINKRGGLKKLEKDKEQEISELQAKLEEIKHKFESNILGNRPEIDNEYNAWKTYLENNNDYSLGEKVIIFELITEIYTAAAFVHGAVISVMKYFDGDALKSAFGILRQKSFEDGTQITVEKLSEEYSKQLRKKVLLQMEKEGYEIKKDKDGGMCIRIPRINDDKDKADAVKNIRFLEMLATRTWCTVLAFNSRTKDYLSEGDFYVYMDSKYNPQIGVRFIEDSIVEIAGFQNDRHLPVNYLRQIYDNFLIGTPEYQIGIDEAKELKTYVENILPAIKKLTDTEKRNLSAFEILNLLGFEPIETGNGLISINGYKPYYRAVDLAEYGIDITESELFKDVVEIRGDADFSNITALEFTNLRDIKGGLILEVDKKVDSEKYINRLKKIAPQYILPSGSDTHSTLQNKPTVDKLNKIGSGKFIKWLYGNRAEKTGDNFRYTVLGVAIGVILETFSLWTPNFIKSHDNPTMGMKITVWVIRALSIGIGVAVALNPVTLPFIIPAVILTEWITHFAWNQTQIAKGNKHLLLQTDKSGSFISRLKFWIFKSNNSDVIEVESKDGDTSLVLIEMSDGNNYAVEVENNGRYQPMHITKKNDSSIEKTLNNVVESKDIAKLSGVKIQIRENGKWKDITRIASAYYADGLRVIRAKGNKKAAAVTVVNPNVVNYKPLSAGQSDLYNDENLESIKKETNTNEHRVIYLEDFDSDFESFVNTIRQAIDNHELLVIYPLKYKINSEELSTEELFNAYNFILHRFGDFSRFTSNFLISQYGFKTTTNYFINEIIKNAFIHGNKLNTSAPIYMDFSGQKISIYNAVDPNKESTVRERFVFAATGGVGFKTGIKFMQINKIKSEDEKKNLMPQYHFSGFTDNLNILEYTSNPEFKTEGKTFYEAVINYGDKRTPFVGRDEILARSEYVPYADKISLLLEMDNLMIYIDVDKSGNSKIVYVNAEIEPDYRDDAKTHEELKIPFDIKVNYDEKRGVWNCLAIKNKDYQNNIKVKFLYSSKNSDIDGNIPVVSKPSAVEKESFVVADIVKIINPVTVITKFAIKIVSADDISEELTEQIKENKLNADIKSNLIIADNAIQAQDFRAQGFNIVSIRTASSKQMKGRKGLIIGEYEGKKIRAYLDKENGELIFYSNDSTLDIGKIKIEDLKIMFKQSQSEGINNKMFKGIEQIIIIENDTTLESVINAMKNSVTDGLSKPPVSINLDFSNRKDVSSSNIERITTGETNNGLDSNTVIFNPGQLSAMKETDIWALQEKGYEVIVVTSNISEAEEIIKRLHINGAVIKTSGAVSEQELIKIKQIADSNTQGGKIIKTQMFVEGLSDDALTSFGDIYEKYSIIPVVAANSAYQESNKKCSVRITESDNNTSGIFEKSGVVSVISDKVSTVKKSAGGITEAIRDILKPATPKQKFTTELRNINLSPYGVDIAGIKEILKNKDSILFKLITSGEWFEGEDEKANEEKLKEAISALLEANVLNGFVKSRVEKFMKEGKYYEALGCIRGSVEKTVESLILSKLKAGRIEIPADEFRKYAGGILRNALIITGIRLLADGKDIEPFLEDGFINSNMTAQQYFDSVIARLNGQMKEIVKQNEYIITVIKDEKEAAQAIADFKDFNLLMQDQLREKSVVKTAGISSSFAVRSILGAA